MDTNPVRPPWKERLRRGWLALSLLVLGLGQALLHLQVYQMSHALRVERLEVFNAAGHPVVILGSYEGQGVIAVADGQANPRIGLAGDPDMGRIRLMQAHQGEVVHLGADAEGNGGIEVHTRKGTAHLGASTKDTPALSLNTSGATLFLGSRTDNDQEPVISLSQGRETRVRIEAFEAQGMIRVWGPGEHSGNVIMPRY